MAYRILADENIERATVNYLRKLGHDIEDLDDVAELGLGAEDKSIARYAREHDRLILTQDDDFFAELDIEPTAASSFRETRRYRPAMSAMRFTRCHSISISPTSSSNTSAVTGCEKQYPRVDLRDTSGTRFCPQSLTEMELNSRSPLSRVIDTVAHVATSKDDRFVHRALSAVV